jgi:AcrR family transcriptional regulator
MHPVNETAPVERGGHGRAAPEVRANEASPVKRTRMSAEQRRESILAAAAEVFALTGYRAGKMSDVAARLGVSEPVVFQNFGSKAALFAAVLDRAAEDMRTHLHSQVGLHGSVLDLLAHVVDPVGIRHFHAPGAPGRLFADAATLTAEPGLAEHATGAIQAVAEHLADLIRCGQAEGGLRGDADPDSAAWLLLAIMSAQSFLTCAMPDRDRDRLENGVTALVLGALAPASDGPSPP